MNDWVDKIESTRLELKRKELEERSIVSSAGTGADTPTPTPTVRNAVAGGVDIPGSSRALTPGSFLSSVSGGGGGGSTTSAPLVSPNTTQLSSSMTSSDAGSSIGPLALPLSSNGSGFSSVALGLSTGGGGGGGGREPSLSGSEISPLPGQRSVRKGSFGGGQSSGGEYFGNEAGGRPLSPTIVSSSEDEDYYEELEGGNNELGGGGGTLSGGGGVHASRPTLSQQHSTSGTTGGGSGSAFSFPSAELMPPATQAAASLRSPGGKILSLSGTSAAGMTPGGGGGNAGSGGAGSLDANRVIMQGYLMKQGKRKNWRKRWFVLLGERLVYSRSHLVRDRCVVISYAFVP